ILQAQWLIDVNVAQATNFKTIAGKGLVADIDQQQYFLGNRQLLIDHGVAVSSLPTINASEVLFANSSQIIAQFELEDVVRADSAQAINALTDMNVDTTLLSGDNENTANTVASKLNMRNWLGQQTPEQKLKYLQQIQNSGHKIAMVGDGINDAPALAQADLGIAMGGGTQVAITSAQITLMKDSPLLVAKAINIAKATWRTVKQNLFLAFAFNTVAIPAAAMGYLSPQLAGLAMALSSVTVLTNALRLKYSRNS
ncbi:MAG: heavy metal translocating P-type ATPase, partial [Psychrobium sp.]